jgi:hypothetical protein
MNTNCSWRRRHLEKGFDGFIKDGIIDPSRWSTAKTKILFLLKESYDGPKDLRVEIRETGFAKWQIWRKCAYWCYACHHVFLDTLPPFPDHDPAFREASDLFLSSAILNIKKSNGRHPSDYEDLAPYAREDGDLIRQQIELISPKIVISGNVWYKDEFWPEARQVYDFVWQAGDRFIVDFWHPACQFPNKLLYYTLSCSLANAVGRSRLVAVA